MEGGTGNDIVLGDADLLSGSTRGRGSPDLRRRGHNMNGDVSYILGNGRGGNDYIDAGGGSDRVEGDGGLVENARGGNDRIFGLTAGWAYGDGEFIEGNARGGNDRMSGSSDPEFGTVFLVGDAGFINGNGRGGDDLLEGYGPNPIALIGDALFPPDGNLSGNARGGNDRLKGGSGGRPPCRRR